MPTPRAKPTPRALVHGLRVLLVHGLLVLGLLALVAVPPAQAVADPPDGKPAPATAPAPRRPNFVIVVADDLGYGDLGCYGNPVVQTPHLDQFAKEGLKFTACYAAAPNCSPSRTGLMTGRTPTRAGIYNWIPMLSPMHVRVQETTLPQLLQRAGYATCLAGKWHLNGRFNLPGQPQPDHFGFDHWFATQNNALPNHGDPDNFVRNGEPVGKQRGFSSHLVVDEVLRWLRARSDDQPFFLYVCFHEPHEPIATAPEYARPYASLNDPARAAHHGNITQMDAAFGRLLQGLEQLKVRDDTFVLFTSDNGPAITALHPYGSPGPLRQKKGHLYEGGIRVPGLLQWPGRVPPGGQSAVPISGVDLLPTCCALAGVPLPRDRALDGANWAPLLEGQPVRRKRPLFWEFHYSRTAPKVAIRSGPWKLLAATPDAAFPPTGSLSAAQVQAMKDAPLGEVELYHLERDLGEKHNLAAQLPERVAELRRELESLRRDVLRDAPSWPDWEFARYESKRIIYPTDARKQQRPEPRAK